MIDINDFSETGIQTVVRLTSLIRTVFLALFLLLFQYHSFAQDNGSTIRVGIFQNYPIVFIDDNGVPQGLYVDLLREIANSEAWDIQFVPGTWSEGLERLRSAEIDLMTSIAYLDERKVYMDFSHENVLTMWGQVYVHQDSDIQNVLDLQGETVAILKGGINGINFMAMVSKFDVQCEFRVVETYAEVAELVASGSVSAGVINNIHGYEQEKQYAIRRSPIIFSPFSLLFAVPEGKNRHLLETIDSYLATWRSDPESPYYSITAKWFGQKEKEVLPDWVFRTLFFGGGLLLFVAVWVFVLRRQVKVRTKELAESRERLREGEERFRTMMEQSPLGIQIMTTDGRIVQVNDAHVKLWGITLKDLSEYNILQDEQAKSLGIMPYIERAFAGEALSLPPFEYDPWKTVKKGRIRWIQSRIYPVKDESGEIRNVVMMHEDITERMQAEEALKEYSERLEEMVEERTKALQEAQKHLVRQEKLAVLGQLAGGMGHELRNPLGAIKNATYFLNMVIEEPEPEVRETLEILEKEVGTSERIISSLLDFARAKPPMQRKVDVNDLVREALSRTTVPENIEVVSQLDQALPAIQADPDQLTQVFGNIILNAVQAMTSASPSALLRTGSVESPEGGRLVVRSEVPSPEWVAISFADTGVGIPEENLDKLFEPLFTTKAKGIGLGLALVKTLVEGHGGSIEVESEVGKGSTFTVILPPKEVVA